MTVEPPAARRRASRAEARGRILDAAVTAFAEQGYEGTSLARVAEAVGMSQPGVLHHFPSKRALLLAVLERRDELDRAAFALSDASGLEVLDRLVRLVEANTRIPGMIQSFSVVAGESVAERHPARAFFTGRYARIRSELAGALARGVDSGGLRADVDCLAVAAEIYAVMDGLQVQWLHDPQAVDIVAIFRRYADRLRADLAAPGEPRKSLPRSRTVRPGETKRP